jgi:hypothetical protein
VLYKHGLNYGCGRVCDIVLRVTSEAEGHCFVPSLLRVGVGDKLHSSMNNRHITISKVN